MKNTSEIMAFKIISETGVAAGVRRIEALTSDGLMKYYAQIEETLKECSASSESNSGESGRQDHPSDGRE